MTAAKKAASSSLFEILGALSGPLLGLVWLSVALWFQRGFWAFDDGWLSFPLSLSSFEAIHHLLEDIRIVLPLTLMGTYLSTLSFAPPLLLLTAFLWATRILPGSKLFALLTSFVLACICSRWGLPGGPIQPILVIAASGLLMTPLFGSMTVMRRWAFLTVGTLLAVLVEDLRPLLFWLAFSLSVSESIHFSVIQRLSPSRKQRLNKTRFVLETLGLLALSVWVLTLIRHSSLSLDMMGPSQKFWLAFVNAALVAANSYLKPWESSRWIKLASFALAPLLFNNLDAASGVLSVWLIVHLLWVLTESLAKDLARSAKDVFLTSTLATSLILAGFLMSSAPSERELNPQWAGAITAAHSLDGGGLIVGRGFSLASTFLNGPLVINPKLYYSPSADPWTEFLKAEGLSWILIEVSYVKSLWEAKIQSKDKKVPVESINRTFLAHLVLYQGKETTTSTLKLKAISDYEILKIEGLPPGFMLVGLKK